MKNLKKVLSLVLALAMTLSLMTVAFADVKKASAMTNYDKTSYAEAMDVMVALGVIDGVSGDLQPTANVTREQAAKMIAVMIGGDDVKDMYTTSQYFSDVATTRWSAAYIAYCVEKGIVSGVGGGKFNPTGDVTGYQFAKMLLVGLGYKADNEGYTGTNWAVNVATDAAAAKLFKGVTNANKTIAATREEVAQYCLNALKAAMVEYTDDGTNITIGSATINVGASKASKVADDGESYCDYIKDTGYIEFGEQYFNGDKLKLISSNVNDRLARPANKWTINDGTIGTYTDTADKTITMNAEKTLEVAMTDGDYLDYNDSDVTATAVVYLNGDLLAASSTDSEYQDLSAKKLGIGDVVEVFETSTGTVSRIVVIRYAAAKIAAVDDDLSRTYTKNDAAYGISLTEVNGGPDTSIGTEYLGGANNKITIPGVTLYDAYKNTNSKVLAGFDASTYTEDTILAVAVSGDEIVDNYVAVKYAGTIGSYKANTSVTADDTHKFALGYDGDKTGFGTSNYAIYSTVGGQALAITGATAANLDDVYFVTGTYSSSASYASSTYYAQAVSVTTGEVSEIKLEHVSTSNGASVTTGELGSLNAVGTGWADVNKLYTFTDKIVKETKTGVVSTLCNSGNGKFNAVEFTSASADYDVYVSRAKSGSDYTLTADVKADSSSLTLNLSESATKKTYFNGSTTFRSIDNSQSDIAVASATGIMKMAQEDPSYTIVITADGKTTAKYVLYIGKDMDTAVGTSQVVYLATNYEQSISTNTSNDKTVLNAWFMENMKNDDITISEGCSSTGMFYSYGTTSENYYKLSDYAQKNGTAVDEDVTGAYEDVKFNSYNADNHILTATADFTDISYANATFIDNRTADQKDASLYSGSISSVSSFEAAMKKAVAAKSVIVADVYVEDGVVTFVAVTSVDAVALTGVSYGGNAQYTDVVVPTTLKAITLTNSGTSNVVVSAATGITFAVASTNTDVVTVSPANSETFAITANANNDGTANVTVTATIAATGAQTVYTIPVTVA